MNKKHPYDDNCFPQTTWAISYWVPLISDSKLKEVFAQCLLVIEEGELFLLVFLVPIEGKH